MLFLRLSTCLTVSHIGLIGVETKDLPGIHDVPRIERALERCERRHAGAAFLDEISDLAGANAVLAGAGAADLMRARSTIIELGALSRYERPQPSLNDYDALLGQKVAS